nr:methyltransferase domain-containing protein [Lachnospiraceae bacterium]
RLGSLESFNEGLFSVQDLSSMAVGELAAPEKGMYIIDMCAAPGGKTCHAAELMLGTGMVDSRDVSEKKTELILENQERLALKNIKISVKDATVFDEESKEKADIVIADLPCSGLGVIGRKNDLKYRVKPEDINELASLQREILANAVQYVKPGGKLVFSTCTITKEETTDQAEYIEEVLGLRRGEERKFLPDTNGSDGFYAIEMLKDK